MKKSTLIISSAILAVGLFCLGLAIKAGIDNSVSQSRTVTVRGLCEREVSANKVTWPIVTKEVGNDLSTIYSKTEATNATILEFLRSNGISDDEIMVSAPDIYDAAAERYSSNDIRYRYTATNVIVVTSDQIEKVNGLIRDQSSLLRQGIAVLAGDYQYSVHYEYTGLNDIKPEMVAQATANAREAADKFADDSHSKLGKIKTASQGQFTIEDRDQYTPSIKTVRVVTSITYYLKN